jgi:hypothetical protein
MLRGIFMSQDDLDIINVHLEAIDTEVGATITFADQPSIVLSNMFSTNISVNTIRKILNSEK